ncbi:hypothetical protein Q5752_005403 [Cryptotrichosporon argae]
MTSPMHKFLFSPPPSPPHRASASHSPDPNRNFTSLRVLLPPALQGTEFELKPRSPRTPQNAQFFFAAPTLPSRPSLDATPRAADPRTPRQPRREKLVSSPPYLPVNVPSVPLPAVQTSLHLPRPVIRLLFLCSLVLTSVLLLVAVPESRLPTLHTTAFSRRLALGADGLAYVDVGGYTYESAYAPPQVRSARVQRRLLEAAAEAGADVPVDYVYAAGQVVLHPAAAPPRASRPAAVYRPLPPTHELAALRSYLLESDYNALPSEVDGSRALDAHAVLGVASHRLGEAGSQAEQSWLRELEGEHAHEVTVFYGLDSHVYPHDLIATLAEIAGFDGHPSLVHLANRDDRDAVVAVFGRHGMNLRKTPVLFVGNEAVPADARSLEALKASGELRAMLKRAGWVSGALEHRL